MMKVYLEAKKSEKGGKFSHLSTFRNKTRQAAMILCFASVFVFFFKILFL